MRPLEAVFADRNVALIIGFVSFLLALSVVAIRQEISTQVGDTIEDRKILRSIPDNRWRLAAQIDLEEASLRYLSWAGGTRRVSRKESLHYEVEALTHATASVRAIHLAGDLESLKMWIEPGKKFRALVEAYQRLPASVQGRRILVLNSDDDEISGEENGRRVIRNSLAQAFCSLQTTQRPTGLGFSLRVLWIPEDDRAIGDLLIIDDREFCSIESYGHGEFSDLVANVNEAQVRKQSQLFDDLWTNATPIEHALTGP